MLKSSFKPKPINEQTVVITGASSGIGLATARLAARKGARVVLSARSEKELEQCCEEIRAQGGEAIAVKADVTSASDLQHLCAEARKAFGQVDAWINNAGTSIFGYLLDESIEDERQLFETNFWGVRHGCVVAVEEMREHGGVIINLGSEVSVAAQPLLGMYSASKHAVKAYTDALRSELRDLTLPIEVCLVRPTAIDTPFADHAKDNLREGEPSLPAPMYSPEVAALGIVNCLENPRRDVYIGGPARLSAIIDTFFPAVKDIVAETRMKDLRSGTEGGHAAEAENLHSGSGEGEATGGSQGLTFNRSYYTTLTTQGVIRDLTRTARETLRSFRRAG
jgi:short-subunit dehydrogenase